MTFELAVDVLLAILSIVFELFLDKNGLIINNAQMPMLRIKPAKRVILPRKRQSRPK